MKARPRQRPRDETMIDHDMRVMGLNTGSRKASRGRSLLMVGFPVASPGGGFYATASTGSASPESKGQRDWKLAVSAEW